MLIANIYGFLCYEDLDEWYLHQDPYYRPEAKFGLFRIDRNAQKNDFRRQKTKGALALEVVIKQSLSRNEDGLITDSAIEEGEQRFGSIDADGLIWFQPQIFTFVSETVFLF